MARVGVVIPVLNNFQGAVELIASIRSDNHDVHVYIEEQYRHQKPLAGAWNDGFDRAVADGCHYVFIVNDDILFDGGTVDNAVTEMWRLRDENVIMVTANNLHDKLEDPYLILGQSQPYKPGDISDSPNYSCFLVKNDFFDKVGRFDENFYPAWCEDQDSHHRITALGYRAVCTTAVSCVHFGSVTTKKLQIIDSSRSERYFIAKWGSRNPNPPQAFAHPYNNSNLTPKDWIKDYNV